MRVLYGRGFSLREGLILLVLILATLIFYDGLRVPDTKVINALETQGFSNVSIIDRRYFFIGVPLGYSVRIKARAVNPSGKKVLVNVYAGLWKKASIRTP